MKKKCLVKQPTSEFNIMNCSSNLILHVCACLNVVCVCAFSQKILLHAVKLKTNVCKAIIFTYDNAYVCVHVGCVTLLKKNVFSKSILVIKYFLKMILQKTHSSTFLIHISSK